MKYTIRDYVIIGWQEEDDLPLFGKIESIAVIQQKALLCVIQCRTEGFDHHFNCYVITRDNTSSSIWLSDLVDYQPLRAHSRRDRSLCVVVKCHVERI